MFKVTVPPIPKVLDNTAPFFENEVPTFFQVLRDPGATSKSETIDLGSVLDF